MAEALTKREAIEAIVKEAKKLDKLELQILLTKLRIKHLQKAGVKPVANPPKNLALPTIEQIDRWKHASRRKYAGR